MLRYVGLAVLLSIVVQGKIENNDVTKESGDQDLEDSSEKIGPVVTQIYRHPYAASILKNNMYLCSAVVLNTYWLLAVTKCFDADITSTYVSHKHLGNYTARVGSSYNNKGGSLYKIRMLINNFDLKVSAVKMEAPMVFGARTHAVQLPNPDGEVSLGYLASMLAWTPTGHIRVVNAPIIDAAICENDTKLIPGHYICMGGVQDPDRHFCRQDNGGAVIQNDTLVAISTFHNVCAVYTKTHAFPRAASFVKWLDTVIWDEGNRPTTAEPTTKEPTLANATETTQTQSPYFADPSKFLLTLPFDPVNVPLEPAEDNSVIPRMSLYESYLQNLAKAKTSTTQDPNVVEEAKREWLQKYGRAAMMAQSQMYGAKKYGYCWLWTGK
ncbi:hypothetical protein K1T71_013087 [Dendrolimus kikuchii]|uniref:Uncharacterized protein n=1 Tax=Dendrolimus kikuchii TaxID=765133 RepID=A0ACC1CJ69_9NEOP|nr:hypothetical protein K1T71_013087 [Dendrolimus kikuchii]